jgi:hypothetical protein
MPGYGVQAALAPQLKQWNASLAPVTITPPRLRFSLQMGQLKVTQPDGVLLCLDGKLSNIRRCVRSTIESKDMLYYSTEFCACQFLSCIRPTWLAVLASPSAGMLSTLTQLQAVLNVVAKL